MLNDILPIFGVWIMAHEISGTRLRRRSCCGSGMKSPCCRNLEGQTDECLRNSPRGSGWRGFPTVSEGAFSRAYPAGSGKKCFQDE